MRPSYIPHITVPDIIDTFNTRYPHPCGKEFEYLEDRKSFIFKFWIDFPTGWVFPNRACRYLYVGHFWHRGIFSPKDFQACLKVMAYPSEEFKNNGYAYIETFCIKDRGLSNIDEKLHRIGDAMAKDLQKFIDSKRISIRYSEGPVNKATWGGSSIEINLSKQDIESNDFNRRGEILTE